MVMKVSFDFDDTLDRPSVQKYAKELIEKGFEVWICTARMSDDEKARPNWNKDLYKVADELGIARDHIKYMDLAADKCTFFKDKDFIWHLDDDWYENRMITKYTNTKGLTHIGCGSWIKKCNILINKYVKAKKLITSDLGTGADQESI